MRFFLKNTQTLIGSWISIIAFFITLVALFIYPNITQSQDVFAIYDPLSVPNNKFGIHIIQATIDESSPAAQLVNTNGDWGYITVLIEAKDKNQGKWQEFFNDLRRRHLIPIVRLATIPEGNIWKRPDIGEASVWADFLDSLNWPTKNRYVVIYNEPNHGTEWGGTVDPKNYAEVLDQTAAALKSKNRDFFVLNAGFDASAPSQPPNYEDQISFMRQMEVAVPGIFNKLDGWVSHSYPQPNFAGSPTASGRGTVRTYVWELQQLRQFGVTKSLPVFITETGWKHSEGKVRNVSFPNPEDLSGYFQNAFQNAWNNIRIVAITPFLLSYQDVPFDHFSFKKYKSNEFYPHYLAIKTLPKVAGKPIQDKLAMLTKGEIYSAIVSGEAYDISLTFKNTGQSIWYPSTSSGQVRLVPLEGGKELGINSVEIPGNVKIEPGGEYTFNLKVKAPDTGSFKVVLNLFEGQTPFDSKPFEFKTEVKSPVILQVKSVLKWKKSSKGEYLLRIEGAVGESVQKVYINENGESAKEEARYLLPEYTFDFSLEKPFYNTKTISQKLKSGENILDFGELAPNIFEILIHPITFFKGEN